MTQLRVEVIPITSITPHPNADRLELVNIGGYSSVVQKGIHSVGDRIVYIPEDALFTDVSVPDALGIRPYLAGKNKDRVRPVKLRGVLSQGIVLPKDVVTDVTNCLCYIDDGYDFAHHLGIVKYEPPIPIQLSGEVRAWPSFLHKYDVENIKNPKSLQAVEKIPPFVNVVLTEKLHGTNIAIAAGPDFVETGDVFVCSKNLALKESDANVYWRVARQYNLIEKLRHVFGVLARTNSLNSVVIHGEVIGVQDLMYGLKNGDLGFRAFDISVNGEFVSYPIFKRTCELLDIPIVPELYVGKYDYDTLYSYATGQSTLTSSHIREGGVMRPLSEIKTEAGERVCFKFINPDYLTRRGGSEFH